MLTRQYDCSGIDWSAVASLFIDVGWGPREPAELAAAFATSSHMIFIHDGAHLVAVGRTLDDGRYYAMLVDVAVSPLHQGAGLGAEIATYLRACLTSYRIVTLTAAPGKAGFYRRLGWLPQSTAMIWPTSEQQRALHVAAASSNEAME